MALCLKEESIQYGAESQEGVFFMALRHTESILYGAESHEDEYPLWC